MKCFQLPDPDATTQHHEQLSVVASWQLPTTEYREPHLPTAALKNPTRGRIATPVAPVREPLLKHCSATALVLQCNNKFGFNKLKEFFYLTRIKFLWERQSAHVVIRRSWIRIPLRGRISLLLPPLSQYLIKLSLNRSLEEVQHFRFSFKKLCSLRRTKLKYPQIEQKSNYILMHHVVKETPLM